MPALTFQSNDGALDRPKLRRKYLISLYFLLLKLSSIRRGAQPVRLDSLFAPLLHKVIHKLCEFVWTFL